MSSVSFVYMTLTQIANELSDKEYSSYTERLNARI